MSKNNTNDKIRFFPMSTIREGRKIKKFTSVCVITNGPYVKGLVIHASPITCHTFPLSSSPSLSLTIPLHHFMLRNENSLYPPPNAMGTHHLSVDGQQMWTQTWMDAKNCENDSEHENNQNVGQDSPCECGQPTPSWTSPFPLLSRDVCIHKMSKQEHRANPMTAPPSSHDIRT